VTAARLLSRPELTYEDVAGVVPPATGLSTDVARHVETEIKYSGYIARERERIERLSRLEDAALPDAIDYGTVHGLSTEANEKLQAIRPRTLGQAGRIPGVSPADVAVLMIHLKASGGIQ
jgi:tRNA uridine 5-carboxymethylaminomethyl modification enzyme